MVKFINKLAWMTGNEGQKRDRAECKPDQGLMGIQLRGQGRSVPGAGRLNT